MSQGKQHEAGASEGARRATGEASALSALVGTGRWSARRKVSVVIEWLKGGGARGPQSTPRGDGRDTLAVAWRVPRGRGGPLETSGDAHRG